MTMMAKPTTATRSEGGTYLDFAQVNGCRREPNRSFQCDSGIAGSEESHLAHTLDISEHGVQLGGFRGELKVGDKFEIHYRHKRAQFRVVWITAREGSTEK